VQKNKHIINNQRKGHCFKIVPSSFINAMLNIDENSATNGNASSYQNNVDGYSQHTSEFLISVRIDTESFNLLIEN
jgi:hypothetical protein